MNRLVFAGSLLVAACHSMPGHAEVLWINTGTGLYSVDSATPGAFRTPLTIYSGTIGGDSISAIDIHPTTGALYGYAHASGRFYTISKTTAVATPLGVAATTPNAFLGMTFEGPSRIRVVHYSGSQFTVDPVSGTVLSFDSSTAEDGLIGVGYDSAGATTYGLEEGTGALHRIGSLGGSPHAPGTGMTELVGMSGIFSTRGYNLDISTVSGIGYVDDMGGGAGVTANLWTIDLSTGLGTYVGALALPFSGSGGIAVDVVPGPGTSCGLGLLALGAPRRSRGRSMQGAPSAHR
jgi:hypothetical protein